MAGNTSRIDSATLLVQWLTHRPMAEIAAAWTITSHQLVRLREVWGFPPRNDRRLRYKPTRAERMLDPDAAELAASENSLDLAPRVAERVTCVQVTWDAATREERQANKPTGFTLARIEITAELAGLDEDADEL